MRFSGTGPFNTDLTAYVEKALRDRRPLGLLMVDIDRFKQINDTHGHPKGDGVLAGVAALLEAVADGKGKVYRYGGDEIVVLLQNHGVQEATAVAERMRVELDQQQIEGLSVTASFGVSVCPDHCRTAADLVKAADSSMYDAKSRGRNLVRVSGEPEPAKPGPREVERKTPRPGALTENEKANLRIQHFSGEVIRCPQDGAIFTTQQLNLMGHDTPMVIICCPLSGTREEI
jgi:diguanylate cyclase (GGDEF)-like protein